MELQNWKKWSIPWGWSLDFSLSAIGNWWRVLIGKLYSLTFVLKDHFVCRVEAEISSGLPEQSSRQNMTVAYLEVVAVERARELLGFWLKYQEIGGAFY